MTNSTATLIRNGRVITASDDYVADVLLQDGIVHTIGQAIEVGPGVRVVDWEIEDPAGRDLETVRAIRDDIEGRVRGLLRDLGVEPAESRSEGERA